MLLWKRTLVFYVPFNLYFFLFVFISSVCLQFIVPSLCNYIFFSLLCPFLPNYRYLFIHSYLWPVQATLYAHYLKKSGYFVTLQVTRLCRGGWLDDSWIGKYLEGFGCDVIEVPPSIFFQGLRKATKKWSPIIWRRGRSSYPTLTEHKTRTNQSIGLSILAEETELRVKLSLIILKFPVTANF